MPCILSRGSEQERLGLSHSDRLQNRANFREQKASLACCLVGLVQFLQHGSKAWEIALLEVEVARLKWQTATVEPQSSKWTDDA